MALDAFEPHAERLAAARRRGGPSATGRAAAWQALGAAARPAIRPDFAPGDDGRDAAPLEALVDDVSSTTGSR